VQSQILGLKMAAAPESWISSFWLRFINKGLGGYIKWQSVIKTLELLENLRIEGVGVIAKKKKSVYRMVTTCACKYSNIDLSSFPATYHFLLLNHRRNEIIQYCCCYFWLMVDFQNARIQNQQMQLSGNEAVLKDPKTSLKIRHFWKENPVAVTNVKMTGVQTNKTVPITAKNHM